MLEWIIFYNDDDKDIDLNSMNYRFRFDFYQIACSHEIVLIEGSNNEFLLIDGFVFPRLSAPPRYMTFNDIELVSALYSEYGSSFVNYIKGEFTVIILKRDSFEIYSDHIGLKKFFYVNKRFCIASNKLSLLPSRYKVSYNVLAMIKNSLYYHYVDQETIYQDILFNLPSHHLIADNEHVLHAKHWKIESLFLKEKGSIFDLGDVFSQVISQHLQYVGSDKVAMTLTGGFDSRLVLSAILNNSVLPMVCVYGDPMSPDVEIAKIIAQAYKLDFYNPNTPIPTKEWFSQASNKTLLLSDSLSSIFRSFRFSFMSSFIQDQKPSVLFTGYLGGEGIRGYDGNENYESGLFFDLTSRDLHDKRIKQKYQDKTFFQLDSVNNQDLQIKSLISFDKQNERTLAYLYEVIARVHHGADIDLLNSLDIHVANPFLDIDYLSFLHRSGLSFLRKRSVLQNKTSYMNVYYCLIKSYCPSLLSYDLKNGYTMEEYKKNILLAYVKRKLRSKIKQKSNFTYGKWFREYINDIDIKRLPKDIFETINYTQYTDSLSQLDNGSEAYWLKHASISTLVELIDLFSK